MTKPHFTNTDNPIDFPKSEVSPMKKIVRQFERESHIDVYGLGKDRVKWEATLEKFAELIVRECIEICNQHPSKTFKKEWDADVVAWDITQRIKGRFGVEE